MATDHNCSATAPLPAEILASLRAVASEAELPLTVRQHLGSEMRAFYWSVLAEGPPKSPRCQTVSSGRTTAFQHATRVSSCSSMEANGRAAQVADCLRWKVYMKLLVYLVGGSSAEHIQRRSQ